MGRPFKHLWVGILVGTMALGSFTGCRRKSTPPPAPAETPVTPQAGDVSSASANGEKLPEDRLPTAPPDSSLRFPIQQELTGAVHLYQTDFQKLPPDFETLVRAKYLKAMPKPPAGKRFAVDRKRLQVVIMD